MARESRSGNIDKIFGICSGFKSNRLPTNADVLKHFLFYRRKGHDCDSKFEYIVNTTSEIQNIWMKTKIPIILKKSIQNKVIRLLEDYDAVFKYTSDPKFDSIAQKFRDKNIEELFDIAACKCTETCKCAYVYKIPMCERDFLADQRSSRQMVLDSGSVGAAASSRMESPRPKRSKKDTIAPSNVEKIRVKERRSTPIVTRNLTLENTVRESQRNNVSPQVTATVLNAFMKDIQAGNEHNAIDRNKIIRETKKFNSKLETTHIQKIELLFQNRECIGLFFDGKKDKTNMYAQNDESRNPRVEKEDHYTLVFQPGNQFYSHVTPTKHDASGIAECIWNKLQSDSIDVSKIMVIGSDGTNLNVGHRNGT